jgi:hypothetical protein
VSTLPPSIPPAPASLPGLTPPVHPLRARRIQIAWLAVLVIVVGLILRACEHRDNTYEGIARELTEAVQNNDLAAVQKLENSETAVDMTRARLGQAADALSPLGHIRRLRETAATGDPPRVHEFDVSFDKGAVHEKIQFDPDNKVFHFRYDRVPEK